MQVQRRKRSGRRDPKRKDHCLVPFSHDKLFVPAGCNQDETNGPISLRLSPGAYSRVASTIDIDSLSANDDASPVYEVNCETVINNNQKRKSSPILIGCRPPK